LRCDAQGHFRRSAAEQEIDGDSLDVTRARHGKQKSGKAGRDEEDRPPRAASELREAAKRLLDNIRFVDHSTRLITHQRQFVVWNATLGSVVRRHFLEWYDPDSNTTTPYHFPTKLLDLLPVDEPLLNYKTCAVVGNSGVSLLHASGSEIDSHDAVFRMNLAPVRGFEEHVGSRTTFQIVNSPNIREMLTGSLQWRTNDNSTRLVMFETATRFARQHLAAALLEEHGDRALLLNPSFSNQCHRVWMTLKESLEAETGSSFHRKPMSGFFATFMALQVCDHVDLYGFDAYTSSGTKNLYHYFDHVQGFTDVHSFDLAMHIFNKVSERGILSVKS